MPRPLTNTNGCEVTTAEDVDQAASTVVPPSESTERLPGPDVVRAVALIGVVIMNFHGYLIFRGSGVIPSETALQRFFHPFEGPLSTRFASTFVLTAGVGITLLTRKVVSDLRVGREGAREAVTEMRWRLVRRGLVLYVLGQVLDVIWSGTIIFFYGAMFVVSAVLFSLSSRVIVAIGIAAALAGWWIEMWAFWQREDGQSVSWLSSPGQNSIRRFVFDLMVNGTHPLLPWLAFLCAGIVLGRALYMANWRLWCSGIGLGLFFVALIASELADTAFTQTLLSPHPYDRGLVYVASALGSSLVAFAGISWLADQAAGAEIIDPLRRAGQMTLTLYIAHILVFNLLVDWLGIVEPDGLGTALALALCFWVVAIVAGMLWNRRFGRGPVERVYRAIGG
jgi:uncharacterized protein